MILDFRVRIKHILITKCNLFFQYCDAKEISFYDFRDTKVCVIEGRKELKRYDTIFTCLASRAVRTEITNSVEKYLFILALRRFIARCGNVGSITSDYGTNFVSADNELKKVHLLR